MLQMVMMEHLKLLMFLTRVLNRMVNQVSNHHQLRLTFFHLLMNNIKHVSSKTSSFPSTGSNIAAYQQSVMAQIVMMQHPHLLLFLTRVLKRMINRVCDHHQLRITFFHLLMNNIKHIRSKRSSFPSTDKEPINIKRIHYCRHQPFVQPFKSFLRITLLQTFRSLYP